jgi:hypothetical protein
MSSYNPLERTIARFLNRMPFLKQLVKSFYARVSYLQHKKSYIYQSEYKLKKIESDIECFFGYYDKSPSTLDGYVLVNSTKYNTKDLPLKNGEKINICVFEPDLLTQLFCVETNCFNWQQGSRAQWINEDLFIFNDFDPLTQKYISRVFSKSSQSEHKVFNYPVQDLYRDEYFISLNYQRLMALRPDYGYRNLPSSTDEELLDLENDGLWRIDFKSGDSKLLVSLADICLLGFISIFDTAVHKVNHAMIAPDGTQFIFMHRYFAGQRRFDRLILANAQSGQMKLLSDYGMVSHSFWLNNKTILGYMRGPANVDSYWLIDIITGEFTRFSVLDGLGDGHPHVYGDWFVTDTYPDKARMQHLFLINWKTGEKKELGEFFHGFEFSGETRCDLHPRFSMDGNSVFFDSVFDGERKLYKLDLK